MSNSVTMKELMLQVFGFIEEKFAAYSGYKCKHTSRFPEDLFRRVQFGNEGKKVVLLLGEKGAGKTALAIDMVRQLTNHESYSPIRANVLSLTHSSEEIALRLLSVKSRVALNKLRSGNLTSDDWRLIAGATGELADATMEVAGGPLSFQEVAKGCSASCDQPKYDLTLIVSIVSPEDLDFQSTHAFLDKVITQLSGIQSEVVICLIDLPDKCLSQCFVKNLFKCHESEIWMLCRDREKGRSTSTATLMVGGRPPSNHSVYKLQYNKSFEVFEYSSGKD